jgi:tRNA A-37 threonylcarbamoyl transferase component Bud32
VIGRFGIASRHAMSIFAEIGCPKCGEAGRWQGVMHPSRRQGSVISAATCGDCGYRVFVKTLLAVDGETAEHRALHEFETASRLYAAAVGEAPRLVPNPIALCDTTIVYEFIHEPTLLERLRRGTTEQQRHAMRETGQWFARFHGLDMRGSGTGDFVEKHAAIAERVATAGRMPGVALQAVDELGRSAEPLAARRTDIVAIHGDAKPANFMVTTDGVLAVDVDGHFSNVREMDLAQFLVQTDIALAGPLVDPEDRLTEDLEQRFLEGYAEQAPIASGALDWWKTYFWLSFWVTARQQGALRRIRLGGLCRRRVASRMTDSRTSTKVRRT